ncbi:heat shock 70 kDa protein 12B-like isoform X2 [Ostrea edulis]|uniref:heat shock 70 kDa protein 12B-like isoform X2 n=1 Tax=Ostrea edulis TaxID=37623 RepID=UPI0024AFD79C|nr:heat shock 70 kDa protein 12B-like isoform X2 [Ostrea edulis]XP_056013354.1 heat shock 70 kDa protein 12B-like isoform X2 [Ostrea edulis]XP_056013356.1 heat shock 70 kDa protein 12B-like isoform X2 [Ostrea edulis]
MLVFLLIAIAFTVYALSSSSFDIEQIMSFSTSVMVAAIDLGTVLSGYAFSFRYEFEKDPLKIMTSNWIGGSPSLPYIKTPSVVLLKPNKTFHAFGCEAENKYASLVEDNEHEGWLYFKRFKMTLHQNKSLKRTTTIKDVNGEEMPAMTIFTMAIKYFKDHLMGTLKSRVVNITEDVILWVLTVPAIWDDGAKQFMREAAAEAGILREQLLLVSEPEAAIFYYSHFPMETNFFEPGTKYMVLDLGGTCDTTVVEVQSNQSLRELHHVTDFALAGTKVDDAFYQFLAKLFGNDVLSTLKDENMDDYIAIFREFELKKLTFKPESETKVTIILPFRLLEIFEEQTEETLIEVLQQTRYAETVQFIGDRLRIRPEIFKEFFSHTLQGIIQHITEIMQSFQGESVSKILLVGDFSNSPMVLNAIKESFPNKTVTTPADPGLVVLKGAVLFGQTPRTVSCRFIRTSTAVSSGIGM